MNKILVLLIILLAGKAGAQSPALSVADSLYTVGEYSEAIAVLKDIDPVKEAVHLKMAKIFQANGDLKEAEIQYELILKESPERTLTALDYAKLLVKLRNLKKADSIFSLLSEKHPGNANFRYQLGLVKEIRMDSSAIDHYKMVVQLESTHQEALYKLAKNELQNGQYNMAVNYSLMGLNPNPDNVSLLSILAQSYSRQQKHKLAIPPFEKLLELGQGNEFIHSRLGYSYYQQEFLLKAVDQYNLALEFEDRNSDTHYNLGKIYALIGDLEKSEIHLLMAILIKKQPVDGEYLSLGLTYKLKEDHKKALEYFNRSLEENPDNERALYEKAVAADNYFKDLKTKLDYYQAYLNKYSKSGNEDLLYLAKTRMKDIREELHLAGE